MADIVGPTILARTMSVATTRGSGTRAWQYHSRSDTHSKVACWTLLFDLLLQCDALRDAARRGKIGFGINHVIVGPINKTLDLVVTWDPQGSGATRRTLADLVPEFGILLESRERAMLDALPALAMDADDDLSEVGIAIAVEACMTDHVKSLPRLHAEILATGYLARCAVRECITVAYSLVNAASTFVKSDGSGKLNRHTQPADSRRVVEMLAAAIRTRSASPACGYDAIGVTVLDCRNDGSPVSVVDNNPSIGPHRGEQTYYERMVRSVCSQFRARFALQ
jgi:hypothetical protein